MSILYEDEYIIPSLGTDYTFPNPREACDDGLLAYGGDLHPQRILSAYEAGIFPWFNEGDPPLWWSPNPRFVLYPNRFKVSKSLEKTLKKRVFEVKIDTDFENIIEACANTPREGQNGTWILPQMQAAYNELFKMGFAHSVASYFEGKLVGGLYGVAIGKVFFGESMFSHKNDASKVCLKVLSDVLGERGYYFIDCQIKTDHLVRLGACEIERDLFLDSLKNALQRPSDIGSWQQFYREYRDD
ncbi:MAG: leucyl/phenylalanyl-tRNA--protein transferase [Campylobacterales bacterium]|nr:leucyl/phenylalanyl-tRNA--protein transferase [Campylobacterales bacterium]